MIIGWNSAKNAYFGLEAYLIDSNTRLNQSKIKKKYEKWILIGMIIWTFSAHTLLTNEVVSKEVNFQL